MKRFKKGSVKFFVAAVEKIVEHSLFKSSIGHNSGCLNPLTIVLNPDEVAEIFQKL